MTDKTQTSSQHSTLLSIASLFIIIAGLKLAQAFVLPILLAIFLSILSMPLLFWMKGKNIHTAIVLISILVLLFSVFSVFGTIIAVSASDLMSNIPFYEEQLINKLGDFYAQIQGFGFDFQAFNIHEILNPTSAFQYLSSGIKQVGSVFTQSLLILIIVAFMLLEVSNFFIKIKTSSKKHNVKKIIEFVDKVNTYMAIKTIISLITGTAVTVFLIVMDIHYPVLWGLLAFILNFVPSIGSIIASIPVILLAIIQYDISSGLIVLLAYLCINFLIGNIIEPKYMGSQLGVSPLIIILSLIFWGWVLGPIGMLLAVPLTIVVKFGLESAASTKWIARLMESAS